MAFRTADLSVLAYANGFTLWHYRTEDRMGEMLSTDYFDPAHAMLRAGDIILANATVEGIPVSAAVLLVAASSGDGVDARSLLGL